MPPLRTQGYVDVGQAGAVSLMLAQTGGRPRRPPLAAYDGQVATPITVRLDHEARAHAAPATLPPVRLFCVTVPDAWLLIGDGIDGVVLTSDCRVVRRVAAFSEAVRPDGCATFDLPEAGALDEVFVGFDACWRNYYHWTCLALAKSVLAAALLPAGTIVLPDPHGRAAASYTWDTWTATLRLHGLADRVRLLTPGAWRIGALRFFWTDPMEPTDIVYVGDVHRHFERAATGIAAQPLPRRIVIARRGANARIEPAAAAALAHAAELAGFTVYHFDEVDFATQAALVRHATHIVGVHGAGLANLMYASAGTRVLELNRPLDGGTWLRPWFYQIASLRRLGYMFLNAGVGDFTAARFTQALDRLAA